MMPSGNPPAVRVVDLVKAYGGRRVVDELSFTVAAGETFALLGPNGAGKTTTVEILEGYRRADGGAVEATWETTKTIEVPEEHDPVNCPLAKHSQGLGLGSLPLVEKRFTACKLPEI